MSNNMPSNSTLNRRDRPVPHQILCLLRVMRHCCMMEHMNTPTDKLIGTAEAARILGKSHRTIHRLVNDGDLPVAITAPGGRVGTFLFMRSDVERLAHSQQRTA